MYYGYFLVYISQPFPSNMEDTVVIPCESMKVEVNGKQVHFCACNLTREEILETLSV